VASSSHSEVVAAVIREEIHVVRLDTLCIGDWFDYGDCLYVVTGKSSGHIFALDVAKKCGPMVAGNIMVRPANVEITAKYIKV
jgi:hypothetical protein